MNFLNLSASDRHIYTSIVFWIALMTNKMILLYCNNGWESVLNILNSWGMPLFGLFCLYRHTVTQRCFTRFAVPYVGLHWIGMYMLAELEELSLLHQFLFLTAICLCWQEGVQRFSLTMNKNIPWRKILEFGHNVFSTNRLPVDLKDKWKKIMAKEDPKSNKGVLIALKE